MSKNEVSRRGFLKASAASLAAMGVAGRMYAAGSDTIRIGIIGCGGQGTRDLVSCVKSSPGVQIVAMGDLFEDRLQESLKKIKTEVPDAVKVTPDKCFVGFDAYQKVVQSDLHMVLLTTPPHFRSLHLQAAIEAGKNVFMEKPAGVDPKQMRSIIKTAEVAQQKKLSIVAGTQRRHSKKYQETIRRIHDGQIGQIVAAQAYWNGSDMLGYWKWWDKENRSDVEWQLRSWPWFTWTSGDHIVEQHVHNLDVINWAFRAIPSSAWAWAAGRSARWAISMTTSPWSSSTPKACGSRACVARSITAAAATGSPSASSAPRATPTSIAA